MTQHSDKGIDLRHCFVEHTGNVWKVSTLIGAANILDTSKFYLDQVSTAYPITWHMNNVNDVMVHLDRILKADLSVPIILRADGCVMNGWHRIIKAMSEGKKYVLAKRFTKDPKPDFVLPTDHPAVSRV